MLYTVAQAAKALGLNEKRLRRWIAAGHVQVVLVGPIDAQHITQDELERVRAMLAPRPAGRAS